MISLNQAARYITGMINEIDYPSDNRINPHFTDNTTIRTTPIEPQAQNEKISENPKVDQAELRGEAKNRPEQKAPESDYDQLHWEIAIN